jgi:Family of unknown function (DUF6459)
MPSRTLRPPPPAASEQIRPPGAAPGSPSPPRAARYASPPMAAAPATPAAPVGSSAWSGLRLVKVPAGWPPYDCENHGAACPAARSPATAGSPTTADSVATAGSAAAAGSLRSGSGPRAAEPPGPAEPAPRPTSPPAPGQYPDRSAGTVRGGGLAHADAAARADPAGPSAVWPVRFAQVIVEVLAGSRSPRQLVPCTTERVRAQIDLLAQALCPGQRPRIRRIMTSRPVAHVVEMTVVVSFGPRSRALAMRFEHMSARQPAPGRPARPARWLCTEIETG